MAWASNWDTSEGIGKLPLVGLNELRDVLDVCLDVLDRSLDSNIYEITDGRLIKTSWFSSFQSAVTSLYTYSVSYPKRFIRHDKAQTTTNGITFCDYEAWTEPTILTAIGDSARLPAPNDWKLCGPWMYQQKKILNLMRWVRGDYDSLTTSSYFKSSDQASPAWPSSWSIDYSLGTNDYAMAAVDKSGSNWGKARRYRNYQTTPDIPSGLKCRAAIMAQTRSGAGSYSDEIFPTEGNNYIVLFDDTEYSNTDTMDLDLCRIDTEPDSLYSDGDQRWYAGNGGNNVYMIWRFDGDDGFEHLQAA